MGFDTALARLNSTVLATFANVSVVRTGHPAFVAVFDHRTAEQDVLGHMPGEVSGLFSGPVPVLTVADAHVSGMAQGERLLINGAAYTVRDLQPDGQGFTVITLRQG